MRPRRRDDLLVQPIEATDEALLVDPQRDVAVVLNPLATAVWLLCDGQREPADICAVIAAELGTKAPAPAQLAADVAAAVADFERENLLWPSRPTAPPSAD